jgi:hypothetical protein
MSRLSTLSIAALIFALAGQAASAQTPPPPAAAATTKPGQTVSPGPLVIVNPDGTTTSKAVAGDNNVNTAAKPPSPTPTTLPPLTDPKRIAESTAQKLTVTVEADGWCKAAAELRLELMDGSPLAAKPSEQAVYAGRLKSTIQAQCPSAATAIVRVVEPGGMAGVTLIGRSPGWNFSPGEATGKAAIADLDDAPTAGMVLTLSKGTPVDGNTPPTVMTELGQYTIMDKKVVSINLAQPISKFLKGVTLTGTTFYSVSLKGSFDARDQGQYLFFGETVSFYPGYTPCRSWLSINSKPVLSKSVNGTNSRSSLTSFDGEVTLSPGFHDVEIGTSCQTSRDWDATMIKMLHAGISSVKIRAPKDTAPRELRYSDFQIVTN